MSASLLPESACRSCGEQLPRHARFCPGCGAAVDTEPPALETASGPVVREQVEARWLGIPARFLLLCLGFAAIGAAIGLFVSGRWAWGFVSILFAAIVFAALAEATRRQGSVLVERSARRAADGRAQVATAAEVWRTQLDTALTRWRSRSQLDRLDRDRAPALQALGEAVWRRDKQAERDARKRLEELEAERARVEKEAADRLAGAEQRIRLARLPVQETVLVAPNQPSQPYPPPDEGNPPQPAQVPEAYPPPDEGTPPTPAPDPGPAPHRETETDSE